MNTFDNEQVLAFKQKIKPDNKATSSVITTRTYVQMDEQSNIQSKKSLKPKNWYSLSDFEKHIQEIKQNLSLSPEKKTELIEEEVRNRDLFVKKVNEIKVRN